METMSWIENSMSCSFDGMVAPFCFPDEKMGPDCLFFLRKQSNWNDFVLTTCQMKFANKTNQKGAIRSITPELLYMKNRAKETCGPALTESNQIRWNQLYLRLFHKGTNTRKRTPIKERDVGVINLLIQFPGKCSRSSRSGTVPCPRVQRKTQLLIAALPRMILTQKISLLI